MSSKKFTWISQHQLLSFFIITYAINCIITYTPLYIVSIPNSIVWFFQVFSPTISAILISGLIGGFAEIRNLLSGFTRWRVGFKWYMAAFSMTLWPLLISIIYTLLGNSVPGIAPGTTFLFLLSNLISVLFSGPLSEEAGWRGFALPRLQKKYNALVSSLILGVVWSCWHIPFYAKSGGGVRIPLPLYIVLVTVLTIFITWIYNNTNGSLILCVLTHFLYNFNSGFIAGFLGLLPRMVFNMVCGGLLAVYVIIIVFIFGPKYLSKKVSNNYISIGKTV